MSRSKRKSQDPDDTTVMIFGEMVREMKALPNWAEFRYVPEFVRAAIRAYLREYQMRAVRGIVEREEPDQGQSSQS